MQLRPLAGKCWRAVTSQSIPWRLVFLSSYTSWLLASERVLHLHNKRLVDIPGLALVLLATSLLIFFIVWLLAKPHAVSVLPIAGVSCLVSLLASLCLLLPAFSSPIQVHASIIAGGLTIISLVLLKDSDRSRIIVLVVLACLLQYVQAWDRLAFMPSSTNNIFITAALPIVAGLTAFGIQHVTSSKPQLYDSLPVLALLSATLIGFSWFGTSWHINLRAPLALPWIFSLVVSALMTCIENGALAVSLSGLACHFVVDLLDAVVMQVPLHPWSFCLLLLGIIVLSIHLSKDDENKQDATLPWLDYFIALAGILCVLYAASGRRPLADVASPAAVSVTVGQVVLNMTKVASLIETRLLPILVPLLSHWLANVPEDWPFVVWTSLEAKNQLMSSATLSRAIASGRLNLTILPDWVDVGSGELLSRFLTKPWYWHAHDPQAEWMLFFQADSILCSASEQTVDDWLGYDFVGAPCPWSTHDEHHGGNGGLSMRKISSMQRITNDRRPDMVRQDNTHSNWRQYHGTPHEAEDWWALSRIEMLVPDARWPEDRSQNIFSISWGAQDAMRPLGVHRGSGQGLGLWQKESGHEFRRLISYCPELLMIQDYAAKRIPEHVIYG